MGTLFSSLKADEKDVERQVESVGGNRVVLPSDIYDATIAIAYTQQNTSKESQAIGVTIIFKIKDVEHRETFYVSDRKGNNYYTSSKGNKIYLPGFTLVDDLCMIATGGDKHLSDCNTKDVIIEVYNFESKQTEKTTVISIEELQGAKVKVALSQVKEYRQVKQTDASGKVSYVPSDKVDEKNVVRQFFDPDRHMTVLEAISGKTEPEYYNKWLEKNKDKLWDKTANVKPIVTGDGSTQEKQELNTKPKVSLFGKKS